LLIASLLASCAQHRYQVIDRLHQFGPIVAARLQPAFDAARVQYPPRELAYLAFKDPAVIEVYARNDEREPWRFIKTYPVLAASGHFGPKLREGDRQVPEGFYDVEEFNANSRNHLAVMLGYPNAFDWQMAEREGRTNLGGEIMIHGGDRSIGCLAVGDDASEDFFVLTALANSAHVRVLISPVDFRTRTISAEKDGRAWVGDLYARLRVALREYPSP